MKFALFLLLLAIAFARGQGFLVDQQSTNLIDGAAPWGQFYQPMGQSFTPLFSSVGFVQLNLFYSDSFNNSGSVLSVNVRSNSITGPILGSSATVFVPGGFIGITNFLFSTPLAVVPGVKYYFQPVQSGGNVSSYLTDATYAGGSEVLQGNIISGRNLWFQEGVVTIPEPASVSLMLLGSCGLLFFIKNSLKSEAGPVVVRSPATEPVNFCRFRFCLGESAGPDLPLPKIFSGLRFPAAT